METNQKIDEIKEDIDIKSSVIQNINLALQ